MAVAGEGVGGESEERKRPLGGLERLENLADLGGGDGVGEGG